MACIAVKANLKDTQLTVDDTRFGGVHNRRAEVGVIGIIDRVTQDLRGNRAVIVDTVYINVGYEPGSQRGIGIIARPVVGIGRRERYAPDGRRLMCSRQMGQRIFIVWYFNIVFIWLV